MNYDELIVWQKAMDLVTEIYKATVAFPSEERFGLSSQARRAAVSIPSILPRDMAEKRLVPISTIFPLHTDP